MQYNLKQEPSVNILYCMSAESFNSFKNLSILVIIILFYKDIQLFYTTKNNIKNFTDIS